MTKVLICSLFLTILPISNILADEINQPDSREQIIKTYTDSLSLEEKIAQLFLINLENDDKFLSVEYYEKDGVKKTLIPGGYIFFGYNIADNASKIMSFTDSIIEHAYMQGSIVPYLCVDVEGGYVNRLRSVAGPLAENERVSNCLTADKTFELYESYAKQMRSLGFNLNLAPVSEICTDKNKDFLSGRSYGDKGSVIKYSSECVSAYQKNEVAAILKHFPGNTNVDPHTGLPKIEMSKEEFDEITETFSKIIEKSHPAGVLMSHAVVPSYDSHPSCLSRFWVTDILRTKIGYDGLIFSDDIFMGALIDNGYSPEKACRMAVDAGINCIMISQKTFKKWLKIFIAICEEDPEFLNKIEDSLYRILSFKIDYGIISASDLENPGNICFKGSPLNQEKFSCNIPESIPFRDRNKLINDEKGFRYYLFNTSKKTTEDIYYEYFYGTADKDEKYCLNIKERKAQ